MANNLDAFIPEIWSMSIINRLDQVNVAMAVAANRNYEGEIRQAGDTVWVRTFGDITVQPYVRNQTISYQDLVPTKESLTINEAHHFAFKVDQLDQVQNDINAIRGYSERAAVSLSNLIDNKIFSYYGSAYSANKITNSSSAYTVSASNAYTLIVDAGKQLDLLSVPTTGRWIVISPNYKSFLLKDTTYFIKGSALGDSILQSAMIGNRMASAGEAPNFLGQIAGFDVYWSTNLPADSGGKYAVYGQGKPISYAAQIPGGEFEALRLEQTFATAIRGLLLHDGKVFAEDSKRLGTIYIDS